MYITQDKWNLIHTDASWGADAEQHDITAVGVVQELDEFMQHYGDRRHTHTMLQRDKMDGPSIILPADDYENPYLNFMTNLALALKCIS